jgi:hypothetical protein
MKKSIKSLETKAIKNLDIIKGGDGEFRKKRMISGENTGAPMEP